MNKYFLLLCCLFLSMSGAAQSLVINGYVAVSNSSPAGARVLVAKNGAAPEQQAISPKGSFTLRLAFGADYTITFGTAGYVTKIVSVNAAVPQEIVESNPNFPPVKLIINLLPRVEGVDISVFDQPIAILAYDHELDDFTFDRDYSDKISKRIALAEQEIKRKIAASEETGRELERKFAELVSKGQGYFDRKLWNAAIDSWTQALALKPDNEEVKQKIAAANKELGLEEARRSIELQNEKDYKLLISSADSLFSLKKYTDARDKYTAATKLNSTDAYPTGKIREIDSILAALAKQDAENQKQLAAIEAAYQKAIAIANQTFGAKEYDKAITDYRQALNIRPNATYPRDMIAKAEQAIIDLKKQQANDAEKQRLEQEKRNSLKNKYAGLIDEADAAFHNENYGLARLRYTDADNLNLGEEYPKKQIQEIDNIINSSKYKAKLAEYTTNKTLAQKNKQEKNYAAAKVYYQNALAILSFEKEPINEQIAEIDRLIEASQLVQIEKEYKTQIEKADKAYNEKAYAVARFYYKKALEVKIGDKYATGRLEEVENNIGERQVKEAEL